MNEKELKKLRFQKVCQFKISQQSVENIYESSSPTLHQFDPLTKKAFDITIRPAVKGCLFFLFCNTGGIKSKL